MINQVNYLGVVVQDLAAATAFYRGTLGLPVDEPGSVSGQFTLFKLDGGAMLGLQAWTEIPGGQPFEPAFLVDDIDATYAAWRASDVEMIDEPNDQPFGRTFLFRTPDGHVLRAYQPPGTNGDS
jgi:predicted enzyme related to lactoylglutathione lyase